MSKRSLLAPPPRSIALALALALAACSAPKPEPEFASSAGHGHYAREFPEKLNAVTKDFSDRRVGARRLLGELGASPANLRDPPSWAHVQEIYERPGEDGR